VQHQGHRETAAEDVLADVPRLGGLGDRRLQDVGLKLIFAADVDEAAADPAGVGSDVVGLLKFT